MFEMMFARKQNIWRDASHVPASSTYEWQFHFCFQRFRQCPV